MIETIREFFERLRGTPRVGFTYKTHLTGYEKPNDDLPNTLWLRKKKKELDDWDFHFNPSYITHIIIHHSLTKDGKTVNWHAIRRYHIEERGWVDIGYHLGVERIKDDYQIMIGRPLNKRGAHVKDGGFNNRSVGICVLGNWDLETPPERQWKLTVLLVKRLIEFYREHKIEIPVENVIGHREAQAEAGIGPYQRKSCPGEKFYMDQFRKELKEDV